MEGGKSFWKSLLLCGISLCPVPLLSGSSGALGRRQTPCKDREGVILQINPLNLLWKMHPGEDDVQLLWGAGGKSSGGRGRTCHPFPGKRELDTYVCRKCFFSLGACKGVLWKHKARIWAWVSNDRSEQTIYLFVAGEQSGIGTKGNVNALLLLGELAAGGAHPTASKY